MDLWNNQKGINFSSPNYSSTQLANLAQYCVTLGLCRYLNPTLTPAQDPNWANTHGITTNTALIPTNQ